MEGRCAIVRTLAIPFNAMQARRERMPRPIHFDMTADDPERAAKFYGDIFGWTFTKWEGPMDYWMISTGPGDQPGIDGGLGRRRDAEETTTNVIDVQSVDDYIERIVQAGGKVITPKGAIPGTGYLAYCADTEGNLFGLMQFDSNAA
jgi:predicted enzyme related to lactoylglutathione lyase